MSAPSSSPTATRTTSAACPGFSPSSKSPSTPPSSPWPTSKASSKSIKLLDETDLIEITPKEKFTLGPFTIEPIRVTHSLVDCVALAIETPVGVVIHTGDFKIDLSPLDGHAFDLHTFAEYGKRGVLALLQDSTNVERSGYTPSERAVIPRLDEVFSQTKKKLFFTCFSSSIYRIRSPSSWPASTAARSPSSAAP
jgi:mRNA degradation ribonuclease J1/J2